MGDKTGIQWCDATWNPVVGCSIVSPGCTNCYAMKMAARIEAMSSVMEFREELGHSINVGQSHYDGTTQRSKAGAVWTGKVALAPEHILTAPLRWKRPRRIFVNSMGDLFHESVPDEWIDRVFAVMALAPQHIFQVLTKRSRRMLEYMIGDWSYRVYRTIDGDPRGATSAGWIASGKSLPNVWLGVSAEDSPRYYERADDLRATPAAVRFFSFEPLLEGINASWLGDWAIVGGESGPDARPNWVPNVRSIVKQCRGAGVPVFVKQMGSNVQDRNDAGFDGDDYGLDGWNLRNEIDQVEHDIGDYADNYQGAPVRIHLDSRKGADMEEWPRDLMVREFPR